MSPLRTLSELPGTTLAAAGLSATGWLGLFALIAAQSMLLMLIAIAISISEQVLRVLPQPLRIAWPEWITRPRRPVAHQSASAA